MVLEHQALDQRKTFLLHNMPSITREKETVKIALYKSMARGGRGGGETRTKRNKSALCLTSTCILGKHKNTAVLQFFKTSTYLYHVLVVKWFKKWSDFRMTLKNELIWRRYCWIGQSCCSMTSKQSIILNSRKFSGMKFFHPSVRLTNQKPRAFVSVR